VKIPLRLPVPVALLLLAGPLAPLCPAWQGGDAKVAELRRLSEADASTALPPLPSRSKRARARPTACRRPEPPGSQPGRPCPCYRRERR